MKRAGSPLLVVCLLVGVVGCGNHLRRELLESELRNREIHNRELKDELQRHEHHSDALQREINSLRQKSKITPEQAAQTFTLRRIALGRMTGGVDNDKTPGDEALQVYLEPYDGDDHVIKAPGQVQIDVLQITSEGMKVPLSTWDIGPEQLRRSWRSGLLSSGYVLVLPWKVTPMTQNVRVVARLTLSDGRTFEADRDVKIRLSQPRPLLVPPHDELAPPPRKLEGFEPVRLRPATSATPSDWRPALSDWRPASPNDEAGSIR